ncbi:AP-1 complex subunit sigma-1 [Artemisia annua]|uniref:AP-1 complex subunit sigma-1 n=1 Tax=Artemisia annua TaxID=35608 RepID=A0A2U1NTQ5_ARTAN|nr:AP-1 complex subunit sigma-1 [Artemisia annua]
MIGFCAGPDLQFSQGLLYILDEVLIAGELHESSKKTVARLVAAHVAKEEANSMSNIIPQATKHVAEGSQFDTH